MTCVNSSIIDAVRQGKQTAELLAIGNRPTNRQAPAYMLPGLAVSAQRVVHNIVDLRTVTHYNRSLNEQLEQACALSSAG